MQMQCVAGSRIRASLSHSFTSRVITRNRYHISNWDKKGSYQNGNALRFFDFIDPCREMSSVPTNQGPCRCGSYAKTSTLLGFGILLSWFMPYEASRKASHACMNGLITCLVSPHSLSRPISMLSRVDSSCMLEPIQLSREVSIELLMSLIYIYKKFFSQ